MARIVNREVIVGVGELAAELGVHRQSIWAVMNGTRTSHRLHEALRARGFHPASIAGKRRRVKASAPESEAVTPRETRKERKQ